MNRLPLFLALALLVGCNACRTDQPVAPDVAHIPNLAQVDTNRNVWRSGQFNAAGLEKLKAMGIKRILKLNTREESTTDDLALMAGLKVRFAPISVRQQLGQEPIPRDQIITDMAFMAQGDCLVHCEHGQDRTGIVVACYRVTRMEWTHDAALKEMNDLGFHRILHGLSEFFENYKP